MSGRRKKLTLCKYCGVEVGGVCPKALELDGQTAYIGDTTLTIKFDEQSARRVHTNYQAPLSQGCKAPTSLESALKKIMDKIQATWPS